MKYRRTNIENGTYFFTVNLMERTRTLLVDEIDVLRDVMNKVMKQHPFKVDAMVVLPDHLHAMWTLPLGDKDYPVRWMLIKSGFSRQMMKGERRSASRIKKAERGIWQRRYWEHLIRDDRDYEHHVNYIHYNPVKHGYVQNAVDWQYSSIHRYINNGVINQDWGCLDENFDVSGFGER
ncbi:MAG: transposase [Gammaproteobacteria bacterium]|nr:transposase [Gammaproteobacteria bacterium]